MENESRRRILLSVCNDLEQKLRAREEIRCEHYFDQHPWLAEDSEVALDLVYTEYNVRRELGPQPAHEEYLSRFPQWRDQLRHQFRLDELLVDSLTPSEEYANFNDEAFTALASRRFRILGRFARGGIGEVARALDTELNREVAVKSLLPDLIDNGMVRERFLREAVITGRLEHPGIVPVYAMGVDANGSPFYAMRLIHGKNFQEAIQDHYSRTPSGNGFNTSEFLELLRRFLNVCTTIAFAHSRGVIHRDIKPQNIMLGLFGETLVVDWGLAKVDATEVFTDVKLNVADPDCQAEQVSPASCEVKNLISQDLEDEDEAKLPALTDELLIGTPAFMSPEQALGQAHQVGPSSDIFSLGATMHMLLTGKSRFGNSDVDVILQRLIAGEFDRPRRVNRAIPKPLEAICMKALALEPTDRYAAAIDMASDIEHWLADEPISAINESWVDRLSRFGRRNRSAAMAGSLALLLIAVVSTLAALRINNERLRAERQRIQTEQVNARLALDRGIQLVAANEAGAGMLWFERALSLAPKQDVDLRRVILTNLAFARRQLVQRVQTFTREHSDVLALFSSNGNRLLTCSGVGWITVIEVTSGAVILDLKLPETKIVGGHFADESHALIASTSAQGGLEIVRVSIQHPNMDSGPLAPPIILAKSGKLGLIAFNPEQSLVAAELEIDSKPTMCVWGLPMGDLLSSFPIDSKLVDLGFSGMSELIWVNADRRARAQGVSPGSNAVAPWVFGESIDKLAIPLAGGQLFSISKGGSLSKWDTKRRTKVFSLSIQSEVVESVACSDDGGLIAITESAGIIHVLSTVDQGPACESLRMDHYVGLLRFRPKSTELLVPNHRLSSSLWKVPESEGYVVRFDQKSVRSAEFSSDGDAVVTASRSSAYLRNGLIGSGALIEYKHKDRVNQVTLSPDGRSVLTACRDGSARLWNAGNSSQLGQEIPHRSTNGRPVSVTTAAFSPSGEVIATGDASGLIHFSRPDNGEVICSTDRLFSSVLSVSFKPDGKQLAASYSHPENSVRVWDVTNGQLVWKGLHTESVRTVAFSSDGKTVLSASNDNTAQFWNGMDGQAMGHTMQHRGEVFFAKFSPNGRIIVTGGYDANVRLWHVPTGEAYGEPMQHDSLVLDADFNSDGSQLLTGSLDQTARIWDINTCLPLTAPLQHTTSVSSVRFHPSSNIAFTTSRIWHLPNSFPDDPELEASWVRLATERTLGANNSIEWIDVSRLKHETQEFYRQTGMQWEDWQ